MDYTPQTHWNYPNGEQDNSPKLFPHLGTGMNYALSNDPILLNGMKVIFDQSISLRPIRLKRKDESHHGR